MTTTTLDDLYREAHTDLQRGGTAIALKWAFKHAKAVARAARAELAHKLHDADRFRLQLDTAEPTTPAHETLTVATQTLYAAATDLAEARAQEAFTAHVGRIAETMPKLEVAAKPAVAPVTGERAA